MTNILLTLKKLCGVSKDDDGFDIDIIIYANSVMSTLSQLGLSEADELPLIDEFTDWTDLLGDRTDLELVKTYMCIKTKLMFDPPTSSVVMDSINRSLSELEWRIANHSSIGRR